MPPPAESQRPCSTRPAIRSDLPALSAIWQEFMNMHAARDASFALAENSTERWNSMAADMIARDDTFVFVALHERLAVGFCLGWIARNPPIYKVSELGFISEIAVAGHSRRRGAGRALIGAAAQWFGAHKLTEFQLSTAVWNAQAQQFWAAVGGQPLLLRYRFLLP
jgi:ribosomal protein S18 acetylase RimI-like enzyme